VIARAPSPRHVALACAGLLALTAVAYAPVLADRSVAFLDIDDDRYIVDNPQVTSGLTARGLVWALTSLRQSNWHPLTWMSWQLDAQVFGPHAWGFHFTNVVLHAMSALLLLGVLVRTTGALGRSFSVAGLFAVHPLHVESVGWVSERKDVLSTTFFLLAVLAYCVHASRPRPWRYLLVFVLTALSLMAKSMLVTLPCVLLLLDVWPLRRRWGAHLIMEKVPLLALAGAAVALTLRAQAGMMEALAPLSLPAKVGNALVYYVTYIGRTLWPVRLTPFHPNPGVSLGLLPTLGAGFVLATATGLAWRVRGSRPYVRVGWLWFLGMLLPVIGLVQVGFLATADHYTYVPLIGLFIVLAWGAYDGFRGFVPGVWATRISALVVVVALASCVLVTRRHLVVFHDSVALWEHVLEAGPDSAFVHARLGRALDAEGRTVDADAQFAEASRMDSTWRQHDERGLALEQAGDLWGARRQFQIALLTAPRDETAVSHLAEQFRSRGELEDAIRQYTTLARIRPSDPSPEAALAHLYEQQGDLARAREHQARALQIEPSPESRLNVEQRAIP
jgi:Flp pilus assembly protein TadD